ncbi:MAG TPA: O-antigen ligase family protein [Pseudolabrys sp.]|nr:O-antigen ligase family protein [Pseudolabrys sp.]
MLAGLVVAAAVSAALIWLRRGDKECGTGQGVLIVTAVAAGICGTHVLSANALVPRIVAIGSEGTWISLENLLWPLLLQLFVLTSDIRSRLLAGATLLLIAALSPFRGVVFAIVLFGAVPLLVSMTRRNWLYLIIIGAALGGVLVSQTSHRTNDRGPSRIEQALSQRIVMPLFQAYAAEHVQHLPTALDNVEQKLKLTSGPNLNRFLFQRLYGDGVGETTALFYGEGVANIGRDPLLWIVGAALLPVLLVLLLSRFGVVAGVVAGLAIWRGSLGGISDVFPAMAIQMGALLFFRFIDFPFDLRRVSYRAISAVLLAACVWHVGSGWAAGHHSQLIGKFKLASGTSAALDKCGNIRDSVNRRAKQFAIRDTQIPTTATSFQGMLTIHLGTVRNSPDDFYRMFMAVEGDLNAAIARCGDAVHAAKPVHFIYSRIERIGVISPLDMIALAAALFVFSMSFFRILPTTLPWIVAVATLPYTYFLTLSPSNTAMITGAALAVAALCMGWQSFRSWKQIPQSGYGVILAAFIALVVAHFTAATHLILEGAAFLACLFVIFLAIRFRFAHDAGWLRIMGITIVASVLAGALISAVFVYIPAPWLAIHHAPTDNLRLAGIFDEANAAGRYLMLAFFFFLIKAWIWPLALTAILLAATGSKGALVATFAASIICLIIDRTNMRRSIVLAACSFVLMGAWLSIVQPRLEQRAAAIWSANKLIGPVEKPVGNTPEQLLTHELRIGTSSRMTKEDGVIRYHERPYSIWHTGQRDLLWSAGFATIVEHPLWGIGYKRWRDELSKRLDYPFTSPHNGLLEVTGAYGVIGGILYLALIVLFVRNVMRVRREKRADFTLLWATVSVAGMLVFELVDVSTSLAATLPAVLFWAFLAVQEGILSTGTYRQHVGIQPHAAGDTGAA